ncbi:hypothetical protein ACIOD0_31830 [Kitasatospora albolonga]
MNDESVNKMGTPTPEELREQVERTRDGLGRTAGAPPTAGADIRTQVKERAAAVREQASEKAASASDLMRGTTEQAARLVKDRTPDAVLEKTAEAAAQVREGAVRAGRYAADRTPDPLLDRAGRAASAARANRVPLLAGGALFAVLLLARRGRGRKR